MKPPAPPSQAGPALAAPAFRATHPGAARWLTPRLRVGLSLLLVAALAALWMAARLPGPWQPSGWARWLPPHLTAWDALPLLGLAWATWQLSHWALHPVDDIAGALESTVSAYRDGDFSMNVAPTGMGELTRLCELHAELGEALRQQRQHLVQRELLLDTLFQISPQGLVLLDPQQRVVLANREARRWLADGRPLAGMAWDDLLQPRAPDLQAALTGPPGLHAVHLDGQDERLQVQWQAFRLQGQDHRLLVMQRLTQTLNRQEVESWKKVIRVISHELNNSLAPISSMAHSGQALLERGDLHRTAQVLRSVEERARHLQHFLSGYAAIAKLPRPQWQAVDWAPFLEALHDHYPMRLAGPLPTQPGHFDASHLSQALINLLKNALESGSAPEDIELGVTSDAARQGVFVQDRGPGMSDAMLAQALLPFYSTKRSGSGLGLALAREIVEAHGGQISLQPRPDGGLKVHLQWPWPGG
ncbi:MAG: HAMP domain-containing histidine kinase [Burkholderiaceae bacterium]|nr:MAG: HAMP domain-containing histidine kinase [Burkholderiaceae bacterium]